MCYDQQRSLLAAELIPSRARSANENAMVEALRGRLAETEARLERARAREAELTRRLEEMKRFISVMEILETYLNRRFRERQAQLATRIPPQDREIMGEEEILHVSSNEAKCEGEEESQALRLGVSDPEP